MIDEADRKKLVTQEEDFFFLHYYVQRGHSIKELTSLTPAERLIMNFSLEEELDMQDRLAEEMNK